MPRPGLKSLNVDAEVHNKVLKEAEKQGKTIKEVAEQILVEHLEVPA